jgi:cell division protein FtsB
VKLQTAESGKWNCDSCRAERLRVLEEELRNAQTQIEELTRKNEALVEQLRLMASGKDDRKQAVANVKAGERLSV